MNLGDRVLSPAPRAEAVGTRLEVRLEDRLEHQLQRGLHDPVASRRYPQAPHLARCLGNRLLPTRRGTNIPARRSLRIPASSSAAPPPTARGASPSTPAVRPPALP